MKYFKYFAWVLSISTVLLFTLYNLYKAGFKRFYAFENERLEELINGKETHDILFLGSSRSYFHVDPRVIDSVTHSKSYNGGIQGGNILESHLILQCYLASHKKPKLVVIDIATPSLNIETAPGFRPIHNPHRYFAFLDNPYVFNALKPYHNVFMLKYLPFTQITEADDIMKQATVMGNLGKKSVGDEVVRYHGYRQRSNDTIQLPFKKAYPVTNFAIEEKGVAFLKQAIELCQSQGIKVVLTYAPVYRFNDEEINPEFFPTVEKIAATYNVPFWNYRPYRIGKYHQLFIDEMHLNDRGTYIYSLMLAKDINNQLQGIAHHGDYDSSLLSLLDMYDKAYQEVFDRSPKEILTKL